MERAECTRTEGKYWPVGLPNTLTIPETTLFHNAEVSAARFPQKPFIHFYGANITFGRFRDEALAIAGWLQSEGGIKQGDRVLLDLQNSPQWAVGFYGIVRADAVAVLVNPMNRVEEIRHLALDSGARVAIVGQEMLEDVRPLLGECLDRILVAAYSDYLPPVVDVPAPDVVTAPRVEVSDSRATLWVNAIARRHMPGAPRAKSTDPVVMPYTSGTTGKPKGCVHTHKSAMATLVGGVSWFRTSQDWVWLAALPFFHVTGFSGSLNGALYCGASIVVLTRWDREAAAQVIPKYRVTIWHCITAMVVDLLSHPAIDEVDMTSLRVIRGGGAAMPEAVTERLYELTGLRYVGGYGMSETISATHINPPEQPKPQCLGIPVFDVDSRVIDPETLSELPHGESGEIVVHGPQVMKEYWGNPEASKAAFVLLDGKQFLRTGDLGWVDSEGYFFMSDRLKRMINAAGYKVWPAEVEALLYGHPAVADACVIGFKDAKRGESVKAVIVRRPGHSHTTESDIIAWARERMSAYKVPRAIQFIDRLPMSASGKVLWRELQEAEDAASLSESIEGQATVP